MTVAFAESLPGYSPGWIGRALEALRAWFARPLPSPRPAIIPEPRARTYEVHVMRPRAATHVSLVPSVLAPDTLAAFVGVRTGASAVLIYGLDEYADANGQPLAGWCAPRRP